MNLGQALSHVLKTKGPSILQSFLKEDFLGILSNMVTPTRKIFSFKELPLNILGTGQEILHVTRALPTRIRKAITDFQTDLIKELDGLSDPKEKAILCFKVFGVLSSSTIATFSSIPAPGKGKLRIRSALTKFLLAELTLRSLRAFLSRLLNEIEKELTLVNDLDHVRYLRRLMEGGESFELSTDDPAFRIAERFRSTILNGDDEV